ncbi:MAG TPA: type II CAAX endopeptidase family protein [Blastocatellia bacterium]|nr:type II CAAX endopeptidase family protein [Blastocatellia bacterium]
MAQDSEAEPTFADQIAPPPQPPLDPDNPWWGPLVGLGTWAFSIAASIIIPLIPLIFLMFVKAANGATAESLRDWVESSSAVLLLLISTFPAQMIILLFCWAVVTGRGKRPFLQSLGWHWAGRSAFFWGLVSVGVVIAIELITNFLLRSLPERVSPFEEMLKSSQSIKITTVFLAILTAPLIEEIVYRGVLFSALRKRLSAAATVVLVTLVFVGVHVPQYRGAWRTIAALTLLSFSLTIVRAKTSSILPSFLIHLVNNTVSSIAILFQRD